MENQERKAYLTIGSVRARYKSYIWRYRNFIWGCIGRCSRRNKKIKVF